MPMGAGQSDAELRFQATMEDDVSPQIDRLEKKLKEAGASDAEISMFLKAYDEATPQIEEVQKNLDKMPKEQIINIKTAGDEAKANLDNFTKTAEEEPIKLKFLDNLQEITDKLFNLRTRYALPLLGSIGGGAATGMLYGLGAGAGIVGGATAAIGAVQQGVQVNTEMEQSMTTLTQTLRDQAQARTEMADLIKFAQVSPFSYQDVLQADVRLRSYQIPTLPGEGGPENKGWLQSAGEMAAAMGTPITQAVEAIADARQGYFIRMMTYGIRMMREDFQKGGKYAGLSYEQGLARALERFTGSMEMQSKTLTGVISNIKDIVEQQFYQPLGQEPFGIKKELATSLYEKLNSPDFLRGLGETMQTVQESMVKLWDTVERGQDLFRAHLLKPLQDLSMNLIKIGKTFSQAFGGATLEIIQTVGSAILGITSLVTKLGANVPKFVELYGYMKALSTLGFKDTVQPFFDLLSVLNPLTFSLGRFAHGLIGLPGMLGKLGMYAIIKNFVDAKEATSALNNQFDKLGDKSLDKLNLDVERLAMGLGESSTNMKNLVTYAAQAQEGLPNSSDRSRARGATLLAEQATFYEKQFGVDPTAYIQMITDNLKDLNQAASEERLTSLNRKAVETAVGLEALGQSADKASENISLYGDMAKAAGFSKFGTPDEIEALLQGIGGLTDRQVEIYKSPMGLVRQMLDRYSTPPVTDIRKLRQETGDISSMWNYFGLNNPEGRIEITDDEIRRRRQAGVDLPTRGDMLTRAYKQLELVRHEKGTQDISMMEQYLANEEKSAEAKRIIQNRAPQVAGLLPTYINPYIEKGMGGGLGLLRPGPGGEPIGLSGGMQMEKQTIEQVATKWLEADKAITNLNMKIQDQQQVITDLTNKQVIFQQAMELLNNQMQKYQHAIQLVQRDLEDLQLSTQKFAFENIRPLERQMTQLNNQATIYSNNLRVASYEMNKYGKGLLNGEQAMKNQLHYLELYNKELQLLQLSYTQIGAELGRTTYEQGFSSRVEPLSGISLNMQMQRLQREQQRKELEYELSYGERHYRMQQAARSRWDRTEMPFQERIDHIRDARKETDRMTEAQYRLQNRQFELGQQMFKLNEYMADQQDKMTSIQLRIQSMQQSGEFRALQDSQYELQMTLGRVNRNLETQNINLVKWQELLDPLKEKKDVLNKIMNEWLTSKGKDNIEEMINYFEKIGVLVPKQAERARKRLERLRESQDKSTVESLLGDARSQVEKWFNIFKQTLIGLFTGQTWSLIRKEIANAGIPIISGLAGGPAGGIASTVAGPALGLYGITAGARMGWNLTRYAGLSALAQGTKLLPEAAQTSALGWFSKEGGPIANLAERFSGAEGGIGKYIGTKASSVVKEASSGSDLSKFVRWFRNMQITGDPLVGAGSTLRGAITDPFRMIQSSRVALGAAVGGIAGGPFAPLTSMMGANIGQSVRYRDMISPLSKTLEFARNPVAGVEGVIGNAAAQMGFKGAEVAKATEALGPLASFFSKIASVLKIAGRILTPIAYAITAVQGISDLFTLFAGKGDKGTFARLGGMGVGAIAGGILGGAPGAALGAMLGQVAGDLFANVDWGEVADKAASVASSVSKTVGSFFSSIFSDIHIPSPNEIIKWIHGGGIGRTILQVMKFIHVTLPSQILGRVSKLARAAGKTAGKGLLAAGKLFIDGLAAVGKFIGKAIGFLANVVWNVFTNPGKAAMNAAKFLKGSGEWLITAIRDIGYEIGRAAVWLGNAIADAFSWIIDADVWIYERVRGLFETLLNAISDGISWINETVWNNTLGLIPGLAGGIDRVPADDYQTVLHKDEAVLTAQEANVWRALKNRGIGGVSSADTSMSGSTQPGTSRSGYETGSRVIAEGTPEIDPMFSDTEGLWDKHLEKIKNTTKKHGKELENVVKNNGKNIERDYRDNGRDLINKVDNVQDKIRTKYKENAEKIEGSSDKGFKRAHKVVKDWTNKINTNIDGTKGKIKGLDGQLGDLGKGADVPGIGMGTEGMTWKGMVAPIKEREHSLLMIDKFAKRLEGKSLGKLHDIERKATALEHSGGDFPDQYWEALQKAISEKTSYDMGPSPYKGREQISNKTNYDDSEKNQKGHYKRVEDNDRDHKNKLRERNDKFDKDTRAKLNAAYDAVEQMQNASQKVRQSLQEDHNKNTSAEARRGMDSSKNEYDQGWKSIFGVTRKWIGDVQKAIKGIDEDIGLTKSGGKAKGDPGHHGDDLTVPPHALGGFISGDKYDKRGTLIRVGEEGFDEMVIPLAPHRRDRAINLMKQAKMHIGEFANGGIIQEKHPGVDLAYFPAKAAYDRADSFASGGRSKKKTHGEGSNINAARSYGKGDMNDFSGPHGSLAGMTPLANFAASKFSLQVTSGRDDHSPTTTSGNVSDHSWGGALDLSNGSAPTPQMDAFYRFMHDKLGKAIKQLIYKHMGANTGPSDWYYSGSDHFNHVHTAMLPEFASNPQLMAKILSDAQKGISLASLLTGSALGGGSAIRIPDVPKELKKMGPLGLRMFQALTRKQKQLQRKADSMRGSIGFGGIPVSGNLQQMAKKMVVAAWGASQWPYFNDLVNRESGWNPEAVNPSSGAAGLAQALPPSKYPSGAWPYRGIQSARLQLEWMINYIKGRYGSPAEAIAWHDANNWYAAGGIVPALASGGFTSNVPAFNFADQVVRGISKEEAPSEEVAGFKIPVAFEKFNRVFKDHWAPDWSGETLPFKKIAALAEWAGDIQGIDVPGITMAQVTKGESGGRPGSAGVDPGGTKGYGMWAITSPFNDALVKQFGGYEQMWNPIKNALAMAQIYKTQGLGAWYGDQYVTDPNKHFSGRGYAAGIGRVPSTGPAQIHEGEMILPPALGDLLRSLSKQNKGKANFGNYEEQERHYKKLLEHIEDIRSKLRKAEKHLASAEDKDEKTKWKERISKIEDNLKRNVGRAQEVREKMQQQTAHRIEATGDASGGEDTLAGVKKEREKYRGMVRKSVDRAKHSKRFRKERGEARKARRKISRIKEHAGKDGPSKKQRRRIKRLRGELDDPRKVIDKARRTARQKYVKQARRQGIAPDLIKEITRGFDGGKGRDKDRGKDGKRDQHGGRSRKPADGRSRKAEGRSRKAEPVKGRSQDYEARSLALLEQLVNKDTHVNLAVKAQGAKIETTKRAPLRRSR